MSKSEIGELYRAGSVSSQRVLPSNGRKFELKELQALVGGYIEAVPNVHPIAYCNEEGRLLNLPFNELASQTFGQMLVGDVVQVVSVKRT